MLSSGTLCKPFLRLEVAFNNVKLCTTETGRFQHRNTSDFCHPAECFSPETFAPSCIATAPDEALLKQGDSYLCCCMGWF